MLSLYTPSHQSPSQPSSFYFPLHHIHFLLTVLKKLLTHHQSYKKLSKASTSLHSFLIYPSTKTLQDQGCFSIPPNSCITSLILLYQGIATLLNPYTIFFSFHRPHYLFPLEVSNIPLSLSLSLVSKLLLFPAILLTIIPTLSWLYTVSRSLMHRWNISFHFFPSFSNFLATNLSLHTFFPSLTLSVITHLVLMAF